MRPEGQGQGSDYTFVVIADQGWPFAAKVFVAERALKSWGRAHGRSLVPNEQYAAAKMRLFRAFDECERLVRERLNLVVDETNIEELLGPLELA